VPLKPQRPLSHGINEEPEEVGRSICHEVIIDFVMLRVNNYIEVIAYLYRMSIRKSEYSSWSPLSKTPEVESQRHMMDLLWVGKH